MLAPDGDFTRGTFNKANPALAGRRQDAGLRRTASVLLDVPDGPRAPARPRLRRNARSLADARAPPAAPRADPPELLRQMLAIRNMEHRSNMAIQQSGRGRWQTALDAE